MPISLHAAFVPSAIQMLNAMRGLTERAEGRCAEHDEDPALLIAAKLAPDMLPFAYQIKSTVVHSVGAIAGAKAGAFSPDMSEPPASFPAMRERLDWAIAELSKESDDSMEGLIGKRVDFSIKGRVLLSFTAENFLLSFSQPNFYFHATTAYDILRMKCVPLGKVDFLGQMRSLPAEETA